MLYNFSKKAPYNLYVYVAFVVLGGLFLVHSCVASRATTKILRPDLQNQAIWEVYGRNVTNIEENDKKGIQLSEQEGSGLWVLKNYDLSNGVVEMDIKGQNVPQRSFVGFAFHILNDTTYDAVYFRPFNF
jgi:hypothetical protein